ncbi:MAG: methyltransferase domain-containing protein [Flavobacteriaceae bacterium]|nr:methyltransferase domain-containing protein [Flavobacteriaceae bacterium]
MQVLPYRNLYVGIIEILQSVFENGEYTDRTIEKTFKKNRLWGSRDRGFVAEMVYDMVRWKRLVDYASGNALKKRHYWDFIATWLIINDAKLPDFEEFGKIKASKIKANYLQAMKFPEIKNSVSDELFQIGINELGGAWEQELKSMNEPAEAILRLNTLKTTPKELREKLGEQNIFISRIPEVPNAYTLKEKTNLFLTEEFKNGFFEMQDVSSQLVAPFVDAKPGMRVADTCAGAGGKTLHLANIMENKGQIVAMDIHQWKLNELKKRAKRNAAHNIQTKLIDSNKVLKRFHNSFDRVLIDAPCTGSGVLKRNPDAKYKIDKEFFERVLLEQKEILASYSQLVKKGGLLIYATCSILPSENQLQVQHFLENHDEFELIEEKSILPSTSGYDGFYMAKMKLKN